MSDNKEQKSLDKVLRYRGSGSAPREVAENQAQDNVLRYRGSRGVAELDIQPQAPKKLSSLAATLKPYACGGSSAMFASCCIHPIDLIKVRLQLIGQGTATGARPGILSVAQGITAKDGFFGLYKGLSASLTRQATYGTARIGLYSAFSDYIRDQPDMGGAKGANLPIQWKFLTSFSSGAIASAIGNPFDVSLVRMQADGLRPENERRNYTNVFNAVRRIVAEEGFASLYWGYAPNLLRAIAMNVGMMATYDEVKEACTSMMGSGLHTNLASAGAAGFFCAYFSLPFDMIKTRLQNMKPLPTGEMPYNGVVDCATKIFKNEGGLAFWRGFGAFYGRCAPHAMIILMTREQIMKAYDNALGE
jgi:solute carrier family 25 oxoglutarate transporter 11